MFRQHTNVSGGPGCRLGNEILCGRPGVRHLLLGLQAGVSMARCFPGAAVRLRGSKRRQARHPWLMQSAIPPTGDADARQQADSSLAKHISDPRAPRPEEVERLVAELTSQLTELARQNQELREVQRQLEDYRDRYIDLYDSAPLGYVSLDEDGYIQEINLAGATWLGMDRNTLTGYPFVDYVAKDDVPVFLDHVRKCVEQRCEVTSELRLAGDGGLSRTGQLRSIPMATRSTTSCSARPPSPTSPQPNRMKRRCGKAKNGCAWQSTPRGWAPGTTIWSRNASPGRARTKPFLA